MSDSKRPDFMPEVRQFSQADSRVVQRPEGLGGPGDADINRADLPGGVVKYAEIQASPGSWWENYLSTLSPLATVGGAVMLCDSPLGFPAHSVLVDNWSNQWLDIGGVRRAVPPYSGGWVFNAVSGTQVARIQLKVPSTAITQAVALAGEYVWVGFAEALLPPMTGFSLPAGVGTASLGAIANPSFVDTVGGTNRTYVDGASGNVANANAVATLPAAAGLRTWITGFELTALGSTAALVVLVTVTGVVGGPLTYVFLFPLGIGALATSLIVEFPVPIPSSAVNTAIVVTLPAGGLGNTNAAAVAHGFQEV